MSVSELIQKIFAAKNIAELLDVADFKRQYTAIVVQIHPDKCTHPDASNATAKLLALKEEFEKGILMEDDAGKLRATGKVITFSGEKTMLEDTLKWYNLLMSKSSPAARNFQKYLPESMKFDGNDLVVTLRNRAVPLANLRLEQKHVNWLYSRLLEFACWMNQEGLVHGGLVPEAVFVTPADHGIQVVSFYMTGKENEKAKGISAKYKNWYPSRIFTEKRCIPLTDMEFCQKNAILLLGDESGVGVKLRKDKNVNQEFLNFVLSQHNVPGATWREYREMLDRNFKREFHVLNL
jgi:hypothetical protein